MSAVRAPNILSAALGLVTVSACSASVSAKQVALDKISDKCGLPRAALQAKGEDVTFAPSPGAKYEAVDCALKALMKMPGYSNKIGFIGNERYANEVENNAQKN